MRLRRSHVAPSLALAAAVAPALVLLVIGSTEITVEGWIHFVGVGLAAAVATGAALALTVAGAVQDDGRAVLAGLAFSLMAALLCLHGAATPGVLVGANGVVAFTGGATLPVGCAILALGTLPALRSAGAVRWLLVVLGVGTAGVLALGLSMIVWPALVPAVPSPRSTTALVVLAGGLAAAAVVAVRVLRTYRLTRRLTDLAVVVGVAWLGAALVAALVYGYWNLGWWIGHGLELTGIALVGIPVALDLERGAHQRSRPLWGDLRGSELVAAEEAFLGSHVRALLVALAAKDGSTEEHTRRVARLAAELGDELGLQPGRLRALATGGLLHDIGKLVVPDAILRKPGPLTDEEFGEIRRHPGAGVELLRELGGFDPVVHALVLDHHERLDGSGYPRGTADAEISLEARILAVCDVYDALVSPRVYRAAWGHDRAVALLRDGAGAQFDTRCVDALERVLSRRPGAVPVAVAV
jgi:putative nucleotidyltransferase with HDIG domain